jgi:hypothetical protein
LHQADAVVRLTPAAVARQAGLATAALAATGVTEPDGWIRAVLPIESIELATGAFLAPDIEVLEPADLRASVAATARAIAAIYQSSETNAVLQRIQPHGDPGHTTKKCRTATPASGGHERMSAMSDLHQEQQGQAR